MSMADVAVVMGVIGAVLGAIIFLALSQGKSHP